MSRVSSIRFSDLLGLAWSSLRRNRLRSALTIGAIALGIGVMMFLISLGFGLEDITVGNVRRSTTLLSLGVSSPNEELVPLTSKTVRDISAIGGIKTVLLLITIEGEAVLNDHTPTTIMGADPALLELGDGTKLAAGQYYREEDQNTMVVSTGFLKLFGLDENRTPLVTFDLTLSPEDYPDIPTFKNMAVSGVITSDSIVTYLPRLFLEEQLRESKRGLPSYTAIFLNVGISG